VIGSEAGSGKEGGGAGVGMTWDGGGSGGAGAGAGRETGWTGAGAGGSSASSSSSSAPCWAARLSNQLDMRVTFRKVADDGVCGDIFLSNKAVGELISEKGKGKATRVRPGRFESHAVIFKCCQSIIFSTRVFVE
jgi:hypothetical protein